MAGTSRCSGVRPGAGVARPAGPRNEGCHPPAAASCPQRSPNQLAAQELRLLRDMATAPEFPHVPTSRLGLLAQRLGRVFASGSTWLRQVRERGWRRPRARVHLAKANGRPAHDAS